MFSRNCVEEVLLIKKLGSEIISKHEISNINEIHSIISRDESKTAQIIQLTKKDIISIFVVTVRNSNNKHFKMKEDTKIRLLNIVSLSLIRTEFERDDLLVFFNIFCSLLQEIYDFETCKLKIVSEELMWQGMNCFRFLFDAVTEELCFLLYTKEHAMKICKIMFIVGEILKTRCRNLRIEAIKCLMSMFRVNYIKQIEDLFENIEVMQLIADSYSYFLPGIALSLGTIILEGERAGQGVLELTVEAMGKILTVLLRNYNKTTNSLEDAKAMVLSRLNPTRTEESQSKGKKEDYFNMKRSCQWFHKSDKHLAPIFANFKYLTQHQSHRVRLKLAELCCSLIRHCFKNLPQSSYVLVEILILMSDDEKQEISEMCKNMFTLPILDQQVTSILSDRFHQNFSKIPSVFNGIDTKDQINVLKLTTASIKMVGNKIMCNPSFKEFQRTLLYICEVKIDTSTFAEVISHEDLDSDQPILVDLWKNFKFMQEENVRTQFEELCKVLFETDLFPVLSDYLINIVTFEEEKVEAYYLMNQLLNGINRAKPIPEKEILSLIMSTFQTYVDNWDIPLKLDEDECTTLKTLRNNILQAALLCEGMGLMVVHAKGEDQFRPFLFNCLYKILVRAASSHYQVQAAATKALRNMASGLGYANVTHMLNDNMDFFLFNIERSLKKNDYNVEVFDVMEMVMKYGDVSILQHFSDFVNEVLVQSFDKFKQNRIDLYLRVFRIFLISVTRWLKISTPARDFKTKAQRREEQMKNFKIGGLDGEEEIKDFSDDVMGKSAIEMYREDMKRKKAELESVFVEPKEEVYEKPKVPMHIQITVEILKRSLNFLPSKDANRKLLVLEILRRGVEIIRDFEDELLPIVHLIWSPLVDRFKDVDPVILYYSFELLVTFGRFSKDFIRNRTAKYENSDFYNIHCGRLDSIHMCVVFLTL